MPDRRTRIAETALTLVAEKGLKGLTHRAVDAAAVVPPGTTSNYFRSRAALVQAVNELLARRDAELLEAQAAAEPPQSVAQVADQLAGGIVALTGEHADLTRARLAISLDRPEAVAATHHGMVAGLAATLDALGVPDAPDRARAAADYSDGVILHALTARRGEPVDSADLAATIRRILTAP
jgi:DNA-binding transcriptional regulator YbjK